MTGAGRGLGRAHALEFARQGAKVVVNDLGAELDGSGGSEGPAHEVAEEIRKLGGEAFFVTTFTNHGSKRAKVAFAGTSPGRSFPRISPTAR